MNKIAQITSIILLCIALAGCMYRPNIQQGNFIDPQSVAQLRPGMSPDQVRYIMGTPVLVNVFQPNRWDYVYTYKPNGGKQTQNHVTLYFANGYLQRIQPG